MNVHRTASPTTTTTPGPASSRGHSHTDPVDAAGNQFATGLAGLQAIYLHREHTFGVGGMLVLHFRPHLMFADGSVFRDLPTRVDTFDVAASKASEARDWGTWTRNGDEIRITWPDGDTDTWDAGSWYVARPAQRGEPIAGAYASISGGGNTALGGSVLTFASRNLTFDGDRFTAESTGGTSGAVTAYSSQDRAGTYVLDGHTIELHFNNGTTERQFFYFYPDSKNVLGIGSRSYTRRDKTERGPGRA